MKKKIGAFSFRQADEICRSTRGCNFCPFFIDDRCITENMTRKDFDIEIEVEDDIKNLLEELQKFSDYFYRDVKCKDCHFNGACEDYSDGDIKLCQLLYGISTRMLVDLG